jgi:hypothetical protein
MRRTLGTIAAAAALVGALAACSSSRAPHAAKAANPVAAAAARECATYARVNDQINSATAKDNEVFELVSTMTAQGTPPWSRELSTAAKYADVPAVPTGGNRARKVAAALSGLALQIDRLNLDANSGLSGTPSITGDWNRVQAAQAAAGAACA